ncbi:hypothetical protein [Streptomyces sp. NPDC049040]|uniref:hypothetical protein n=1 Tax=Streptomyces sp. NPDC049040 TaxID=3365593 RepID=UPI003722143A
MSPRLTLEEHRDLGLSLAYVRDELQKRTIQLANAYPQPGPEAVPEELLKEALRTLESVRYELDQIMCHEYPDNGTPEVYYPEGGQRATWRPLRQR